MTSPLVTEQVVAHWMHAIADAFAAQDTPGIRYYGSVHPAPDNGQAQPLATTRFSTWEQFIDDIDAALARVVQSGAAIGRVLVTRQYVHGGRDQSFVYDDGSLEWTQRWSPPRRPAEQRAALARARDKKLTEQLIMILEGGS